MSDPGTPSINGTTTALGSAPVVVTCLDEVMRLSENYDAGHWRLVLRYCHVPADSPAELWESSLQRVLMCSTHLQLGKEAP